MTEGDEGENCDVVRQTYETEKPERARECCDVTESNLQHTKASNNEDIKPAVNFINVLRAPFFVRNFGAKNYKAETFGFETLRDIGEKRVRKMLMKLTPG